MKHSNCLIVIIVLKVMRLVFVSGMNMSVLQRSPDPAAITAKIIKSCYGEKVKEIGLAGDVTDSFIASISSDNPIATVLINSNKSSVQSGKVSRWSRHKLQIFAVSAMEPLELKRILLDIQSSRWWNHMAQFYIFDTADKEPGCSKAYGFLWTAWMMDILGAKVVCNQGADGPLIYAFNPYTDHAPKPWKLVQTYQGVNDHPWALIVQKYHESMNVICANIDFDQTKQPGGYEFRLTMSPAHVCMNFSKTGQISPFKQSNFLLRSIARYMNVTFKMVLWANKSFGYIDEDGKGHGRLADLTKGRSEIVFLPVPLSAVPEMPKSYPFLYQGMFAVTQYTAYLSQWRKVISAIDYYSRITLSIVMMVNVIVLKYLLQQSYMTAILNTVRIICNSCFIRLPSNLGPRIYLVGLFCFVVVIQALFQGQLSALLANHVRLPNINNGRDLVESDYAIYAWHNHSVFFSDPAFEGRLNGFDVLSEKCTDYVLQNSSIACVSVKEVLINDAVKSKLHMSKRPVLEVAATAILRKDWPLENRYNRHNSHYFESGLHDYESALAYAEEHRILDTNENAASDKTFKVLTPADLNFAFLILGFGLGCATISFIVEFYIGRRRLVRVQTRLRLE